MVFGILIDVPLLAGTYTLMLFYRKQITSGLFRTRLPAFSLYLLLAIPLIIFEEQIDCQPSWCGTVLIPPTLPFLLIEMIGLGASVLALHVKNLVRITLIFSVYGVLFELLVGGLVGAPLVIAALLAPYVALGYAYISMLPLRILIKGRNISHQIPAGSRAVAPTNVLSRPPGFGRLFAAARSLCPRSEPETISSHYHRDL